MFIGEFDRSLDAKGRIVMPSDFREQLENNIYITKGMDRCLFVYTEEEFLKMSEKVNRLRITTKAGRGFSRLFYSGASKVNLDKQGRILISPGLREYANLSDKVSVIGVSTRIELWNTDFWENYSDDDSLNYDVLNFELENFEDIDF